MPDPETHHALLRAVGVDPFAKPSQQAAPLPLDLGAMRKLLATPGIKADGCRDRQGTTLLGVAAFLGRVEAMVLLLEHGANVEAANLDGSTPLTMASFGKSAPAAAVLLAYGGDDLDMSDALSDAHATGASEVVAVLNAWEDGEDHPLITWAEKLYEASAPKLKALADEKQARQPSLSDWKSRAEDAERRAAEFERRANEAEAKVRELEKALRDAKLLESQLLKVGKSRSPPRSHGPLQMLRHRSSKGWGLSATKGSSPPASPLYNLRLAASSATPKPKLSRRTSVRSLSGSSKSILLAAAVQWKMRSSRAKAATAAKADSNASGQPPVVATADRRTTLERSFSSYEVQKI